jgi:hypothetical protein
MTRKYSQNASDKIGRTMHEFKHGTLKSGGSGKKVKSRAQAIAIGISQARREGYKAPAAPSHAHKKSSAQLDREIAQALSSRRSHAVKKTVARPTPYRIKLSPSELKAVEFARGRYAWPDMLSTHAADDGSVAFTESEMWQWTDDVDSDDSPFSLAAPAFAGKLQRFYDQRI